MGHPNEEVLRKGYSAFNSGDMDAVRETFAEDIVWHIGGRSPLSGDYKGIEEVLGFFGKLTQSFDQPPQIDIHDVLANDEHGVVLISATSKRGGKERTALSTHVFHLKDGKATEFWDCPVDAYGDDEFITS